MLRGASAEARADLSEQLGSTRTLADAAALGEDLFGVARVLRAEPALRRVLTDSAVEGEARSGLAGNVFGSALAEKSLAVVQDAVQRRWTFTRDLADVLEHLGVLALVQSAGKDGSRVSDELFSVRQLVDSNGELRSALSDQARPLADRTALLSGLLGDRTLPATNALVAQAVSGIDTSVDTALNSYQDIAAGARGETVATVHTARALSTADQQRLSTALSTQYDTTVHLHVVVEPDLVGGLRVEIGDDVIDGTVANRLDDARRTIAG
jgi:F-type H+-transporting ATPase subunit delta